MPRRREGNRQEGAVRDDVQEDDSDDTDDGRDDTDGDDDTVCDDVQEDGDDTNDGLETDEKFNSWQDSLEGDAECAKYLRSPPHN